MNNSWMGGDKITQRRTEVEVGKMEGWKMGREKRDQGGIIRGGNRIRNIKRGRKAKA